MSEPHSMPYHAYVVYALMYNVETLNWQRFSQAVLQRPNVIFPVVTLISLSYCCAPHKSSRILYMPSYTHSSTVKVIASDKNVHI